MGGATALIGLLPTYATIGVAAPAILLLIRVLQGLALGGEYGGAAVYVAEHVPDSRRGFYTSFIQITATLGLFLSLVVILIVQHSMTAESFRAWGWRLPFLFSVALIAVAMWIRLGVMETPAFRAAADDDLHGWLRASASGRELITRWGYDDDVAAAAAHDVSDAVPELVEGAFVGNR
jgi:MFS family permease